MTPYDIWKSYSDIERCFCTGFSPKCRLYVLITLSVIWYVIVYAMLLRANAREQNLRLVSSTNLTSRASHVHAREQKLRLVSKKNMTSRDRHVDTMTWTRLNMTTEMYVLSVYYDDRPTLDRRVRPVLRIITVASRKQVEREMRTFMCIIWVADTKWTKSRMTYSRTGSGAWYFQEYIFVCDLSKISRVMKPKYVSIIDEARENLSEYVKGLTKIPVRFPHKPKRKLNFGLCVGLAYWSIDPYRLVEWAELHRLWGVEEINVYGSSLDETSVEVFMYYHNQRFMTYSHVLRPLEETEEFIFQLISAPVLNDCMYKNMYRYKHIVVVDFDEMIVPRGNLTNYTELLAAIDSTTEQKYSHRMYHFRNMYFFFELPGDTTMPRHLVSLRQVGRLREPSPIGVSTKTIVDPLVCTNLHNHYCWRLTKLGEADTLSVQVPDYLALNQHYKKCHFDKYLEIYRSMKPCKEVLKDYSVDTNMHKFNALLIPRVTKELEVLKLQLLE